MQDKASVADPDPEDPGLFIHPDLQEQNINQNHQKIIPKFTERRLFFKEKFNMAIFLYNMIFEYKKKIEIYQY